MDEMLKVIVATLSGFIIAFSAEPIKIYFQDRSKKQNLRVALYKEIYHNYCLAKTYIEVYDEEVPIEKKRDIHLGNLVAFSRYLYRTECYKQAISQDLSYFYQLKEATMINALYIDLTVILEMPKTNDGRDMDVSDWLVDFLNIVNSEVEFGSFDKSLMAKIADKKIFAEMLKNGQVLKKLSRK
jgi:hypothetical protein